VVVVVSFGLVARHPMDQTDLDMKSSDAVDVIRPQHWLELSTFLGVKPDRLRQQMCLWFTVLGELGYTLQATGANHRTTPTRPANVSFVAVYEAVEAALHEVATRRAAGERVSDQAETRAIAASVLSCVTTPASGE
jgi:hypothetical protein